MVGGVAQPAGSATTNPAAGLPDRRSHPLRAETSSRSRTRTAAPRRGVLSALRFQGQRSPPLQLDSDSGVALRCRHSYPRTPSLLLGRVAAPRLVTKPSARPGHQHSVRQVQRQQPDRVLHTIAPRRLGIMALVDGAFYPGSGLAQEQVPVLASHLRAIFTRSSITPEESWRAHRIHGYACGSARSSRRVWTPTLRIGLFGPRPESPSWSRTLAGDSASDLAGVSLAT